MVGRPRRSPHIIDGNTWYEVSGGPKLPHRALVHPVASVCAVMAPPIMILTVDGFTLSSFNRRCSVSNYTHTVHKFPLA